MNIQDANPKDRLSLAREKIIYKQLKKVLPSDIKTIDIILCAHKFRIQYDDCARNLDYTKN